LKQLSQEKNIDLSVCVVEKGAEVGQFSKYWSCNYQLSFGFLKLVVNFFNL
jgi:hypothetical protein